MNPTLKRLTASFTLLAAGLTVAPALQAQAPAAPGQPGHQPIEAVRPELDGFRISKLIGKPVRGAHQEDFSTVTDFLIDPQSGRVHFGVVDAGSNTSRIIPMSAMQSNSGTGGLVVALDRARWDQVGTLTAQQLEGQVTVDEAHQQRLQSQFQLGAAEQPLQGLIRATQLNGRRVQVGNNQTGSVEDVVIDFNNRIAAPIVKFASNFGGEHRALIHFSRLQVNPDRNAPIVANVEPGEFRQLRGQLSPTGYPSNWNNQNLNQNQQPMQPAHAAAAAVQHAIESGGVVARGSVNAIPETRVILRGVVDSEHKRSEVERAAQQAAPGVRIENQVMVRQ